MKAENQKTMRAIVMIIGILTGLASVVFAQENMTEIGKKDQMQTLFGYDSKITGYGAFDTRITNIDGTESVILGGHGGVIFNSYFYFGIGAYGLVTNNQFAGTYPEQSLDMNMGYTGLMMGFNILPTKVVHFSIPMFIGVGNLELEHNDIFVENSAFLLFEPGLKLEINVVQFMEISLGAGYRMVHGTNLRNDISDEDLSNWSGNFTLVFGKFR